MKNLTRFLLMFGFAAATTVAHNAPAALYDVNRSLTDGSSVATLTGTLAIPIGNYTIQNSSASPFTAVNLTLTLDGTPYHLVNALTGLIFGSAQFFIDATAATLTFNTANGDAANPADLIFSETTSPSGNRYVIGYDGAPGFEVAYTDTGAVVTSAIFPTVFGTAIPEPNTALLLGLSFMGLLAMIQRRKLSVHFSDNKGLVAGRCKSRLGKEL